MTGLGIGVSNMKAGERALLHVGWELGYGKEGNFSFPNVPPMADIVYEVELIGFDEIKEVSCLWVFDKFMFILEIWWPCQCTHHPRVSYVLQGKARSEMTVEERIGAADRRKMDGNAFYNEEKLEEAMQQYEMVTRSYLCLLPFLFHLLLSMIEYNFSYFNTL